MPPNRSRPAGAALASGFLLLGIYAAPQPGPGENRAVEGLRAESECAECHVEIGREWQRSAHADAWNRYQRLSSELGQEATAHLAAYYRPAAVRARDDTTRAPSERTLFPERGIDCVSCHVDAELRMHGPLEGLQAPHATVLDDSMGWADACIPCHGQGDELDQAASWKENGFEQAMLACQSCHMLDTSRRLAQLPPFAELPQRSGRSHAVRGPSDAAFIRSAIILELKRSDGQVRVELTAQGIGHQFPGLGFRQVLLRTRGLDAAGKVLWQRDEVIEQSRNNRLQPNQTRSLSYDLEGAVEVESTLYYKWTSKTPEADALVLRQARLSVSREG